MADDEKVTISPTAITPGPRRATQASTRLLHEWAVMQPWDQQPFYELRLGQTKQHTNGLALTPELEEMLRNSNWYADLVGPSQGVLLVIEAKIVASPAAIGQLEHYVQLVWSTPKLREFLNRPIVPVLLCAVDDSMIHQSAMNKGIRIEVFSPPWIQEYLKTKHFRRRFSNPSGESET